MNKAGTEKAVRFSANNPFRLAYFVTHPIQYQAPLLRRIAQEPDIALKVFFSSNLSIRGLVDKEFGVRVQWDTPLLDGYRHEFLPVIRDVSDGQTPGFLQPLNAGITRAVRQGNFNTVWIHGYHYLNNLIAMRAANSLRIPVLLRAESTLHDRPRSNLKLAIKKRFFRFLRNRLAAVLTIGDHNSTYWKTYLGNEVHLFPCYYAVDNAFFQRECAAASKRREEFRRSLELDPARPIVLFAAKLIPRKRCGDLIEAYLRILQSRFIDPAPYLLIVGDGEERRALESLAMQAGTGDIRFLGFRNQSELPAFYDLCDVFVLPSVDEPWGLAINEVMNAGRAVIVSDQVGCQKNLVKPGETGSVFKAGDVDGLVHSLRTVLANRLTWQRMGSKSLRVIDRYSFEQNISGLRCALNYLDSGFPAVRD